MEHGLVQPLSLNSVAGQLPGLLYAYQLPVDYLVGYDLNFHQETKLSYSINCRRLTTGSGARVPPFPVKGIFQAETEGFVPSISVLICSAVLDGYAWL